MIHLLANFFRGVHFILGMSAPPPGHNERTFVMIWLGVIFILAVIVAGGLFLIPHLYLRP